MFPGVSIPRDCPCVMKIFRNTYLKTENLGFFTLMSILFAMTLNTDG